MHIVQIDYSASVLYDGTRIVSNGSQEMCEAVRNRTVEQYIARCKEDLRILKIDFQHPRLQRQIALEAETAQALFAQAELFT